MSGNQTGVSGWTRVLAVGLASVLTAGAALVGLGASVAHAAAQTETLPDGATVTYTDEVAPGEKITVSGSGWLAKPDMVEEGEEGSVIGFKLIDADLGQLSRKDLVNNPRLGGPIGNATVWGAVWADSEGDFEIEGLAGRRHRGDGSRLGGGGHLHAPVALRNAVQQPARG